ncbi:MAG TPA: DUF3072 domain-containing protein [Candidatus Limnocylindrales bacterium]|jgi:hypothetical protein
MSDTREQQREGDEPATHEQESYLDTLSHELGDDRPKGMTKEGADEKIDELRHKVEELEGGGEPTEQNAVVTPVIPNANR